MIRMNQTVSAPPHKCHLNFVYKFLWSCMCVYTDQKSYMHRRTRQSKPPQQNVDGGSSSDSESNSDSDSSLKHRTASDVINSFLHPSKSVQHVATPKSRKASDVINSFLQKNKIVEQASRSQFHSALDVINSYLRKDNFAENRTSAGVSRERSKECSAESESASRKRRVTESSTSDSDSDSDPNRNVAKKRRIENSRSADIIDKIDEIRREPTSCPAVSTHRGTPDPSSNHTSVTNTDAISEGPLDISVSGDKDCALSEGNHPVGSASPEVNDQSTSVPTTRRTLRSNSSKENGSVNDASQANVKPKAKAPIAFKMSFTREVFSRKTRVRRVIEQQTTIRDCQIPKDKYDRALDMLNATECRYDETPVDYNAPRQWYDFRQSCNGRRHAEATYDTDKLGTSGLISLTRIVFELDNCLKKENWSQMAELIYFGCGLMKTDQIRRAIGGAFFTYALLLLLLDSSSDSISTLNGKRNEILKFLIALGSDPEESEAFLKDLHLVMDENDTTSGLLTIKSEKE